MEPRNLRSGASDTPPVKLVSPSVGYPSPGNPTTGTPAAVAGSYWFYAVSEEMRNVIVGAGLTPNDDELDQFWQAIQALLTPEPEKIGQGGYSTGSTIPSNCLIEGGQELSRASYPDMWSWVQLQSNLVAQATKDGDPISYSAYYGDGDGATTFTLCDIQGMHQRAADGGRGISAQTLFQYVPDENKAHTHGVPLRNGSRSGDVGVGAGLMASGFTASQGNAENTVKNIARLFYVRVLK